MTVESLEKYLISTKLFTTRYLTSKECIVKFKSYNGIISIKVEKALGLIYIDFYFYNELYASYKLSEITIIDIVNSLKKVIITDDDFNKWVDKEIRNYKLETILC